MVQLSLNFLQLFHPGLQRGHFLLESGCSRFVNLGGLTIGGIHCRQITLDATINFLHPLVEFAPREVAVMGIDRLELAAINGDDRLGEEIQLAARHDKLTADVADSFAVIPSKVSNSLEIGR